MRRLCFSNEESLKVDDGCSFKLPQELGSIKTYGYGRKSNQETRNLYTVRLFELKSQEHEEEKSVTSPKAKLAWLKETLNVYESVKVNKNMEDSVYNVEDKWELESPLEHSLIRLFRTKSRYIKFLKKKLLIEKYLKDMNKDHKDHIKLL